MDLVSRLKLYMEHVELPISQFADQAQIPRPTLSQILSGRNRKISNELMEKLHNAFPRLNIAWLLFGDGEMENNDIPKLGKPLRQAKQEPSGNNLFNYIPGNQQDGQMHITGDMLATAAATMRAAQMNSTSQNAKSETQQPSSSSQISINPDLNKKIQTIIVFYNDNSFEIFNPSTR